MKKILFLIVSIVLVMSVVGCKAPAAPSQSAPASEPSKPEQPAEPAKKIVIGWLQKNQSNVFETYINGGGEPVLKAAKEAGTISDFVLLDGNTDPSVQINQAHDLINMGVTAAIIQPAEADGSAPAVKALVDAGIPVIVVNARTNNTDELASAYVGSKDVIAGEMMANFVIEKLGKTGNYGHLMGLVGNSAAVERTQGIHNVMDKAEGWRMLDEQSAEWQGDKASKFAQDWITAYGEDLDAIICDNDDMAIAAKLAVIAAGREDIVVIGVDGIASALQMVDSGELDGTVFQDGNGQGKKAAELAIEVAQGKTIQKDNWIDFILITKDNVGEYLKK